MRLYQIEKYYVNCLFKCDNLEIKESGLYYLKGKNGAGKTTLLNMIGKVDNKYIGIIQGNDSVSLYKQDMVIPYHLSFLDCLNLLDLANLSKAKELLKLLKVESLISKKIHQLSLGEKQRLEIIICLAKEARIYLLDEPFSSLNKEYQNILKEYLKKISFNRIVIISSHIKIASNFNGIISISRQKIDFIKVKENQLNSFHQYNIKPRVIFKNLKYFIFNKCLFLLNILNIYSAFLLLFLGMNFQKYLYQNLDKNTNFSTVFVTEKYFGGNNLINYFQQNNLDFNCSNNVCFFSLKGNQQDIDRLNKQNPYLQFYSIETEIVENIKLKFEINLSMIENVLIAIAIFSFLIVLLSEFLSYTLNQKKHKILKNHLVLYKRYLFLFYFIIVILTFFFSKLSMKIIYKILLS